MPRPLSTAFRRELEEPRSTEFIVILLTISDTSLKEPIRVANDTVSYIYNGDTYVGFPFEMELLDDTIRLPTGRIRIQNVDRQIGEAILALTDPPTLTITVLASSDFGPISNGAREPLGTPTVEYEATNLIFNNISVNVTEVTGELGSFDMTNEPWPAIRSTADRLPGLDP